eukprot:TRINITY_DN57107_c0_g1_i1.p1 TRINITY_DN57107_c0_g1~~TRINITY_DN57107_c0_g1_i1.p1  ORF type:complete len:571 (-),score=110.27 TRINITY_DN57107_c0_g1_i1:49-1761(-)
MDGVRAGLAQPALLHCGASAPSTCRWSGIVAASDGHLYCAPSQGGLLLSLRPAAREVSFIPLPQSFADPEGPFGLNSTFTGVAEGCDGKLYFSVGVWDTTLARRLRAGGTGPSCEFRRASSAWSNDGNASPRRPEGMGFSVMVFDPATQMFSYIQTMKPPPFAGIACGPEDNMFAGIAAAPNGKLYCAPQSAGFVLVVDPVAQDLYFIDGVGRRTRRNKWSGIAAANGRLFCAPQRARSVLVIDPESDTVHQLWGKQALRTSGCLNWDEEIDDGVEKEEWETDWDLWSDIALARNGRLYCSPWDSKSVLVVDPYTWRLSCIDGAGGQKGKWSGIVAANDGRLYCSPYNASSILVIDPVFESLAFIDVPGSNFRSSDERFFGGWYGIAAHLGRIWCAPKGSDALLTLLVSRPDYSSLLHGEPTCDMALEAEDGQRVQCHRFVLATASPVFERMLNGEFYEGQAAVVPLGDVSIEMLRYLVQYIYTGIAPREVDLVEMARLADAYALDVLLAQCLQSLLMNCSEHNVAKVAQSVKRYSRASIEAADAWDRFKALVVSDPALTVAAVEALGSA